MLKGLVFRTGNEDVERFVFRTGNEDVKKVGFSHWEWGC